jgi:hypothetical protein
VSYDLINLVKKLHKVRKNPERVLHVVRSDPANFLRFHGFGIKEHAVVADGTLLQRGREGRPRAGLCFSRDDLPR